MARDRTLQVHSNGLVLGLITQEPHKRARYSDRWICDESWYQLLKNDARIKRSNIVKSLQYYSGTVEKPSEHQLYHCVFDTACPHNGKRRRVQFFYLYRLTQPSKQTNPPSCGLMRNAATVDIGSVVTPTSTHPQTPASSASDATQTPSLGETPAGQDDSASRPPEPQKLTAQFEERPIWWESTDAAILFGFEHGDDVMSGLEDRIKLLKYAVNTCYGYRKVVVGDGEGLSHNQIFELRTKSMYLINAYEIAIKRLGRGEATWVKDVCAEAVTAMQRVGVQTIKSARTVSNWNIMFRTQRGKFPHPNPNIANGKKIVPPIFELVPKFKADCLEFIYQNFDNFVVDMLRDEIVVNLLPKHVAGVEDEIAKGLLLQGCEEQTLLQRYTNDPPSYRVVLSWVKSIGFYRDSVKKSYYSDGHEKPEQKKHRSYHTSLYLSEIEPLCQRWVSVSPNELSQMNAKLDLYDQIINLVMVIPSINTPIHSRKYCVDFNLLVVQLICIRHHLLCNIANLTFAHEKGDVNTFFTVACIVLLHCNKDGTNCHFLAANIMICAASAIAAIGQAYNLNTPSIHGGR